MFVRVLLIMVISSMAGFAQNPMGLFPKTTLINEVNYHDSIFSKANIGCGFLLKTSTEILAVTAKHVLLVAKTDNMQTINFGDELKEWRMYPKDNKSEFVIMDRHLNPDKNDSINWQFFNRKYYENHDYLIFSIKENHSSVKPLELRTSKLEIGEPLYVLGWTYEDSVGAQRTYIYTYIESKGTHFNMRRINAPENGGGLSGSPVVDNSGRLVGIVSGSDENPDTGEQYSSPGNVDYLLEFVEQRK